MNTKEIPAILAGNLTRDPGARVTSDGTAIASISVAVTPRRYDPATPSWANGITTYTDCTVWSDRPRMSPTRSAPRSAAARMLGSKS
jgi:single-stranded DNA-binding protein